MSEWYSRGYLPHRDSPGLIQHITFHLADSLPQNVLERLTLELDIIRNEIGSSLDSNDLDRKMKTEKINRIEDYLDAGHGSSILRNTDLALVLKNVLMHFDENRYILLCWCVMPNHVHVLIRTLSYPLAKIIKSWKSYSAREINRISGTCGNLWHREYFDRYIRDEKHLKEVSEYIETNPVKAGFVKRKEDWSFSSAYKYKGTPVFRPAGERADLEVSAPFEGNAGLQTGREEGRPGGQRSFNKKCKDI